AGTHGIRPGGSALNAGQVGGLRVAEFIAAQPHAAPEPNSLLAGVRDQVTKEIGFLKAHLTAPARAPRVQDVRDEIQRRMTAEASFVRSPHRVREAVADAKKLLRRIKSGMRVVGPEQLPEAV